VFERAIFATLSKHRGAQALPTREVALLDRWAPSMLPVFDSLVLLR
jgi:hypothetical protein